MIDMKQNAIICVSESQKNPKRYENLSVCEQYAKEANCNVEGVFKFQYDDFNQSKKDLIEYLEKCSNVKTLIIYNFTRISRSVDRFMDFLRDLQVRGIAVFDVRLGHNITLVNFPILCLIENINKRNEY